MSTCAFHRLPRGVKLASLVDEGGWDQSFGSVRWVGRCVSTCVFHRLPRGVKQASPVDEGGWDKMGSLVSFSAFGCDCMACVDFILRHLSFSDWRIY